MTRKEAIKNLKELLKWYLEEELLSETVYKREAVDMAISALSTEGEYIKKEDLFNKTIKRNSIWNGTTNAEGKGLEEIVNDLPTYTFPNSAENKGDLISRQAVEKLVWDYLRKATDENIAFYEHFLELPTYSFPDSADDNTMEWIRKPHIYGVTYCSKCDYENKVDDTRFCPNCGRKAVSE